MRKAAPYRKNGAEGYSIAIVASCPFPPNHDWEALGNGILILLKDRALAAKLAANARATVLANFDWRQICAKIECIYDKLLAVPSEAAARAQNQTAPFATRVR